MIAPGLSSGRGPGHLKNCLRTRFISNRGTLFEMLKWFHDEAVTDGEDQRFDQILTVTGEKKLTEEEDFQTHLFFFF